MPVLGIDASRAVKKEKTGVEWYSYFLLRAMEKCTPEGWKVKLYVPGTEQEPWQLQRKVWQWKELKWIGKGWTQGRLSLEMMKSPPDVLFVPSHVIPLVHPANTVTTVHDAIFLSQPELYDPEDLPDQKRGLEFALNFAKKIIVPSRATRDEVIKAGAKPEQVVVIPHGIDNLRLDNLTIGIQSSNHPIIQSPYLLFIGRIEKKKNVLGLIQAFRRLIHNPSQPPLTLKGGELKLVLAGQLGFGGEDIVQAIKTFKLQDKVVHLGWISDEHYSQLLHHATLLVLPSFGEGFGLPVLEAMNAGLPVVCSDIDVLREVGANAVQYVNPRDPKSIASGIETVLINEMLQSEMVRKGKERAQEYSWDKTARQTWEVICNLTGL